MIKKMLEDLNSEKRIELYYGSNTKIPLNTLYKRFKSGTYKVEHRYPFKHVPSERTAFVTAVLRGVDLIFWGHWEGDCCIIKKGGKYLEYLAIFFEGEIYKELDEKTKRLVNNLYLTQASVRKELAEEVYYILNKLEVK